MDIIKKHLKTVGAFLLGVLGNALYDIIQGNVPLPTTKEEALRWALTTLLASLGAYAPRNKRDANQVVGDTEKLPLSDREQVAEGTLKTLPPVQQQVVVSKFPHWAA